MKIMLENEEEGALMRLTEKNFIGAPEEAKACHFFVERLINSENISMEDTVMRCQQLICSIVALLCLVGNEPLKIIQQCCAAVENGERAFEAVQKIKAKEQSEKAHEKN